MAMDLIVVASDVVVLVVGVSVGDIGCYRIRSRTTTIMAANFMLR